jgi:beta-N-acetylhexosaminidase
MSLGPLMLDLVAEEVTAEEKEILQHPFVGSVILFTRNYHDIDQLKHLVKQINADRDEPILICVDHEGGRVQRFRSGFSRIPPAANFRSRWDNNDPEGLAHAQEIGWLMAAELRVLGIDFSFAPVLDLDFGVSEIIGDRAYHQTHQGVIALAGAYMKGMHDAGMAATGKHFPGHGYVALDSHTDLPIDDRPLEDIMRDDMQPFMALAKLHMEAVMPAHVIYEQVDKLPAGFSSIWLQQILRQDWQYDGVIFSDDLNMAATHHMGGFTERARLSLDAGCDMVLACNNPTGAIEILDNYKDLSVNSRSSIRLERMRGRPVKGLTCDTTNPRYSAAINIAKQYLPES